MIGSLGDFNVASVIDFKFSTVDDTGAPSALGSGTVSVYKDNGTTQTVTGVTLTADFDGVTGLNHVRIDTSADGTFYSAGSCFDVVLTAGTVDGVSVAGYKVGFFSLEKTSALRPTVAGRTLNVESDGVAHADLKEWLGVAAATPSVGGVPEVDVTHVGGATTDVSALATNVAAILVDTGTTLQGELDGIQADTEDIQSRLPAALTGDGNIKADTLRIGGTLQTANDVGADVDAILVDTADMQPKLGTPVTDISADIAAIEAQTDDIGTAGAGLTAVPWNSAWDAEVQSEVQDAIEANHLDHLLATTYDPASKPGAADALLNELVESDAGVARYTANALEQAPTGGSAPTAGEIADAVWEEALADHEGTVGSTAEALADAGGAGASAADIADAVWDEATAGHTTSGTFGEQVKTDVDAILADTNELQTDWVNGGRLDNILDARSSQTSVDDVPTNAELATALAAADDAVLAAIAALNNLSQANIRTAVGLASANLDTQLAALLALIDTEVAAILAAVDTEVGAIKTVTDQLVAAQSEPSAAPAANATPLAKLAFLAAMARNKSTLATDGSFALRNDADSGNILTRTDSDDGTTYTRGEVA